MKTTTNVLRSFAAMAVLCLTLQAATAQAQQFTMQRSDPVSMEMKMVFWSSAEGYITSEPLGYVEVEVADSFAKDYSELSGSSEFSMNFDDVIADFANTNPSSKPARIGIVELKDSPGGAFRVCIDRGKTTLCFPLGNETGEEELGTRVQLFRTKDGRLAAVVNFTDSEGVLAGQYPGIRENICMVLPLQETTPEKNLKFAKDNEGNIFALLQLRDGKTRVKAGGDGKGNLGLTVLTPSGKEKAEEIRVTVVMVN
jgi:hypothetical protein